MLRMDRFSRLLARIGSVVLLAGQHASAQSVLTLLEKEITTLVAEARPSVVTVEAVNAAATEKKAEDRLLSFLTQGKEQTHASEVRIGSGLILTTDGFIVTRRSVVDDAHEVFVTIYGDRRLPAEVVGSDSAAAIALLRITEANLRAVRLNNTDDMRPGCFGIVVGNSMGMPYAVSMGIISGIRADGFMQLSANVDPGSSGSPVFNARGEAIGLIAAVVNYERDDSEAVTGYFGHSTLVWPVSMLLPPIRKIMDDYYSSHGWLGVTVNRDPQNLLRNGARVVRLEDDGPGQRAGLRVDDIITEFGGQRLKSMTELRQMVLQFKPGEKVNVGLSRQNTPLTLQVEIGRRRGDDILRGPRPAGQEPGSPRNLRIPR